jgi:hypothetical protein
MLCFQSKGLEAVVSLGHLFRSKSERVSVHALCNGNIRWFFFAGSGDVLDEIPFEIRKIGVTLEEVATLRLCMF